MTRRSICHACIYFTLCCVLSKPSIVASGGGGPVLLVPMATVLGAASPSSPGSTWTAATQPRSSSPTLVTGYGSHRRRPTMFETGGGSPSGPRRVRLVLPRRHGPSPGTASSSASFRLDVTDMTQNRTVRIYSENGGIDWLDVTVNETSRNETDPHGERPLRHMDVDGLFGVYALPSAQLWVWIRESEIGYEAPTIRGASWWRILRVRRLEIVRVPRSHSHNVTRRERHHEHRQVALLRQALKSHDWYYTATKQVDEPVVPDMMHNLQDSIARYMQRLNANETVHATEADPIPDSRFFWNEALVDSLAQGMHQDTRGRTNSSAVQCLQDLVIPVTSAFVGIQRNLTTTEDHSQSDASLSISRFCYDLLLITRRSRFRAGTRFTRRGADATGHCANYAETEQVTLIYHPSNSSLAAVCSHLQTRGSIPLRWSSPTDIKTYRPRVRIGIDPIAQARTLQAHLVDQLARYVVVPGNATRLTTESFQQPRLLFVNLIDKKSDQGRLGKAFDSVLNAVLDVHGNASHSSHDYPQVTAVLNRRSVQHIWFDFHAELKHGRWEKLANLLSQTKSSLLEQGYFRAIPAQEDHKVAFLVDRLQTGITRTNCMDCLDRTNVVQSVFGRYMAFVQLAEYRPLKLPLSFKTVFQRKPLTLPWLSGEIAHRLVWADNADAISSLYAGTPALKGDFTRTGKRTKKGALDDGMNSLQRFYLNNFFDAFRQEGMDLLTGLQPFTSSSDAPKPAPEPVGLINDGLSIQDAARHALLDWTPRQSDDRDHVRIKLDKRSLKRHSQSAHALMKKRSILNLRWLPGDLRSQMINAALEETLFADNPQHLCVEDALETLDLRSSSHLPWWYNPDSSPDGIGQGYPAEDDGIVSNAGYLMVSLVAAAHAPLSVACTVLAFMAMATIDTAA